MSWAYPAVLWLLLVLVACAFATWWWSRRARLALAAVGAGTPHLTTPVGRKRTVLRFIMLWSGLALCIVALAGPRWGAHEEERTNRGADVLLILDCSRSMMATDLFPTRLDAARRKAIDLLRLAPETRLALIPFAAIPVLRCPLTGDHNAIELMLRDCTPDLFPVEYGYQGTAIGDAVVEGIRLLGKQVERGQSILIMSDGADDDTAMVKSAAKAAQLAGIPVYGLFFGDTEREVTLLIDGKEEVMRADRSTLDSLAKETGGICVNARDDDEDITIIHEHLRTHVAQLPWEERRRIVQSERYQLALWPALLLITGGMLIPTRRRRT